MGSLLPSNTFGGIGQELFVPVGGIEPEIDVIVQGTLTVLGDEVSLPTADLVMGLGDITAHSATLTSQVSCVNLTVSGLTQTDRAIVTGELTAGSLDLNGPLQLTNLTADSVVSVGSITGGTLSVGGALTAGNSVINGNLIVNGSLSVTAGLPIPETVCGIVAINAIGGAGLVASVSYPSITSNGVVLITLQTTQTQIWNGVTFSVNVIPGVGFNIHCSAGFGGGAGMAWMIARL